MEERKECKNCKRSYHKNNIFENSILYCNNHVVIFGANAECRVVNKDNDCPFFDDKNK